MMDSKKSVLFKYTDYYIFFISIIILIITGCSVPSSVSSGGSPAHNGPIKPAIAEPDYLSIAIDGNTSDWNTVLSANNTSTANISVIYGYFGEDSLYLLAKGTGFNSAPGYVWFLNTDYDDNTGWPNGGSDFILENGNLSIFTEEGNYVWNESWISITSSLSINKTDTVIECEIPYSILNISGKSSISIGFQYNYYPNAQNIPPAGALQAITYPSPLMDFANFTVIPNGIGMAIDDTGWIDWLADNSRNETIDDYQTIINVGQAVKTRIMTAFIFMNFDKENTAGKPEYNTPLAPSNATEYGTARDNEHKNDSYLDDVMDRYRDNNAYIELGIHGICHEHYLFDASGDPVETSAEFADIYEWDEPNFGITQSWGTTDNELKLQCINEIYRQYFTEADHSFMKSIVPPRHGWYWGTTGNGAIDSTGSVARTFGIKYMNANLDVSFGIVGQRNTSAPAGVIDNGVLAMHRASGANYDWEAGYNTGGEKTTPWYGTAEEFSYPGYPTNKFSWVEAHFPNYWEPDSGTTVQNDWITYLKGLNNASDRFLAKNTAMVASQWLYLHQGDIYGANGTYYIDTTGISSSAYSNDLLSTLVLKTYLEPGKHITTASIDNGAQIVGYWEDPDYDYAYLVIGHSSNEMGRLSQTYYTLTSSIGNETLESYVDLTDATYNVYSYSYTSSSASVDLEMYGTQDVKIKLPFIPSSTNSDNSDLIINNWSYNSGFITINVSGTDIQGETGTLTIYE